MVSRPDPELDRRTDAFEDALSRDPAADLADHLPPADHPLYPAVLAELIRIDLDRGWARGRPRRLAEYRARFPAALSAPDVLGGVAFEEYRQRRLRGEPVTPAEYAAGLGIDTAGWPAVEVSVTAGGPPTERIAVRAAGGAAADTPAPGGVTALALRSLRHAGGKGRDDGSDPWLTNRVDPPGPPAVPDEPDRSDAASVARWVEAGEAFPALGSIFAGFRLEEELGRGAFGRVYLARQGSLAGRPVALKVAVDIVGESRTLAQLQHTNIVPIYSYHQAGRLQAACMPYYGRTTLADVVLHLTGRPTLPSSGKELKSTVNQRRPSTLREPMSAPAPAEGPAAPPPAPAVRPTAQSAVEGWARLDGLSYVEAVLWLGEQLADGLAHAHARGIVHRDLKPANVLLTDEGRPMLLDFNLADDANLRGTAEAAAVGGTLPYMAPEQLEAFRASAGRVDGRCDVYALGVILFELLTGRHPFPVHRGPARETLPLLLADRRQPPPRIRPLNPAVPPAVEAIVRKCLAPDPAGRYQKADDLRDDLGRQLKHLPLKHAPEPSLAGRARKWARRHPRLTSSSAVAAAAAVLVVGLGATAAYARERARDDRARAAFADHRAAFRDAQLVHDDRHQSLPRLGRALDALRGVLARYGVPEDGRDDGWTAAEAVRHLSPADRDQLRADVGETFYMMAQVAALSARVADDPTDRADHLRRAEGWSVAAGRYAAAQLPRALLRQRADLAELAGDRGQAGEFLAEVERTAPRSARDQVLLGLQLARIGQPLKASAPLRVATRLDPENLSGWFVRGTVHLDLGQPEVAAECFAACTALRPGFAPAWLNRGQAYSRLRFHDLAREEYDRALELDPALTEAYVQRAFARDALGDPAGAAEDFGRAISGGGAGPRVFFLRASVRRRLGDPAGAAADTGEGFRRPCRDELDWVAWSEVRLDLAGPAAAVGGGGAVAAAGRAALADVTAALAINPDSMDGLQQQAHILSERLGQPDAALAALDRLVKFHPASAPAVAGRGVLLARAGKRDEALRDARDALLLDTKAPNLYQVGCIYALTSALCPDDRREAFPLLWAALKTGYGLDIVDSDSDLDPLRADPEFRKLVARAKRLHAELSR